ncbi:Symplekin tight junction protein C terminal-domain-containing protein [Gymnopilus junonius]|uniref:Symplekin tight junction protein C terminal-domain-containing protein n=1 Tax=Gymnopilus junonius TaxID=109634 RepID=A0A9P5TRH7_GYMJU|nr:Symplekin tight junction protein C terminal-domain-containing protein [Gymnopilus junonius]
MASNPVDPLQTLQAALTAQADSQEQAQLLNTLRESLESHPSPIPILVQTLFSNVLNASDSLLKRWVLDLLHFAVSRSSLSLDQRTQMAVQCLDPLVQLLNDPQQAIVKVVIQTFSSVYPLVFRRLCTNRSNPGSWNTLSAAKTRIIELVWAPNVNAGVRFCAVKFVQRVVLVQVRGVSDPRLQNKNDPNISFCPVDHPFIPVAKLEAEGQKLLEALATMLYTSQDVDLLTALLNSWVNLVKQRPATFPYVVTTLRSWTPTALASLPASKVKSVEKAVRILLIHMSRLPTSGPYQGQINEILSQQGLRMTAEEKKRRALAADSRKRPSSTVGEPTDNKRIKLDSEAPTQASNSAASAAFLASFDFTSLPAPLITSLIVANLEAFTEAQLISKVNAYRQSHGPTSLPTPRPPTAPELVSSTISKAATAAATLSAPQQDLYVVEDTTTTTPPASEPIVKAEPVDPLQMDIDEDELEYEPEKLNEALSGIPVPEDQTIGLGPLPEMTDLQLMDFKLPPLKEWSEEGRSSVVSSSVTRIWEGATELHAMGESIPPDSSQAGGHSASEMWMLLLVRMITRVAEPPPEMEADETSDANKALVQQNYYLRQDKLRHTLCEYVMADFPSRQVFQKARLATTWMNEEWYNDQIRQAKDRDWRPNYETWLNQIVVSYQTSLDGKDKTFARFLLDLPSIPTNVLDILRDLCEDSSSPDRMQVGFATLRGFVNQRPSLRVEAMNVLLELTTHPEKRTRAAAINTVKQWVPHTPPMDMMVKEFALQMLRKLQLRPSAPRTPAREDVEMNGDEDGSAAPTEKETRGGGQGQDMEDGQLPQEDLVQTPYLPDHIELPAKKSEVLQHVELVFALSVKVPEFLDVIFSDYGQMDATVQEAIQDLITALIRSLGSSHGKLLTLMRQCPRGAESLALRVLTIFTEHGRPSSQLVALVKALINERNLDSRFLIPIIAEMDKADIMRYLPRIVSTLNGQPEPKNLVRSVFSSIVTTPPQTFGSVTSNLPRVRQSELLTPAELMVLLHDSEKEIGRKSAIEAIGICFSMTDVFRSEILAVVMQQIMDRPVLPVLFLRTVIQAVTTYKSLVGFVSTTLLSRLITKKIWDVPPLWEGFIRCAKLIAPASFGALLQLPKDQLRELVDKQPSLKSGLREYVTKRAPSKARGAGFLEIFGEPEDAVPSAPTPQPSEAQTVVS